MKNKKALGVSSFCALLSACGSGLPTSQTKDSPSIGTTGTPALQLQMDQFGTWVDVNPNEILTVNCQSYSSSYRFRLLNNGTGNLASSGGSAVTFNQTTNGSAYNFSVTQPPMPVAASANEEFTVDLAGSGGADCEELTGFNGSSYGQEDTLITINTNDPTNPTYEATIQVLGHS